MAGRPLITFTEKQMTEAIKGSGGVMSVISRRLNCDWTTASRRIKEAGLQYLVNAEDEIMTDLAESKLMENIKNNDTTSIIFRLKTKGKNRGYIERQEYQVQAVEKFDDFIAKLDSGSDIATIDIKETPQLQSNE
jgi:hypothetical protein